MEHLLNIWMQSICSRDPRRMLRLYTPDAVLVATFSKGALQGHQELYDYFVEFLSKEGLCGQYDTVKVQTIPGGVILSGTYTFRFYDGGKVQFQPARYSFVWMETPSGWQIVNHHSSVVPD